MDKETITISFNCEGFVDDKWNEWYDDSKTVIRLLGYEPTHIESSYSKSGKILTVKRSEKKIINYLQSAERVEYLSMTSLPDDYSIAAFDYNVWVGRAVDVLCVVMNKSDYNAGNKDQILKILSKYTASKSYEIFEMDRSECPVLYVSKANPVSFYKTLKIIEEGVFDE